MFILQLTWKRQGQSSIFNFPKRLEYVFGYLLGFHVLQWWRGRFCVLCTCKIYFESNIWEGLSTCNCTDMKVFPYYTETHMPKDVWCSTKLYFHRNLLWPLLKFCIASNIFSDRLLFSYKSMW